MTEPLRIHHAPEAPVPRGRRFPGCLVPAVAGVIVGILLAIAVLVVLAPSSHSIPPPPAATAPANATLTLDDAFLSQLSADALRQAALPFTLSNVRAAIHPGNQITLAADAAIGPLIRPLAVAAVLAATGGHLHLSVTQASVGALALPAALNAVLASALNAKLAGLNDLMRLGGTSYAITSVATQEGLLTLGLAPM